MLQTRLGVYQTVGSPLEVKNRLRKSGKSTVMEITAINSVVGDLLKQDDCDAIVNSAHPSMLAGSGICGLIHKAAGKGLEEYGKQFAPLKMTQAVITPAFDLPNKAIIHVHAPKFHNEEHPESLLGHSLNSVYELAERCQLKSIAIPAIGTGIHGFPIESAIKVYALSARKFKNLYLREVRFVFTSVEHVELMRMDLEWLKIPV
jgi:O-acetyl-ADP-ribose deacetylase